MRVVLVTGGTGELGTLVVQRLVAGGDQVRVLTRHRAQRDLRPQRRGKITAPSQSADQPSWMTSGSAAVQLVIGDLSTGVGLRDALDGVDAVMHCATDARKAKAVDVEGTRRLLTAAASSDRPHLVYVSIVGVDRIPLGYYKAKLAAEQLIEASGLPFTIQRATQFPSLIQALLAAQSRLPVLLCLRGVRFQPVDPAEVADRLVQHLSSGQLGRAPDMGGPQVILMADLARSWLITTGRRRAVLPVPVPGQLGQAFRSGANLCPAQAVTVRAAEQIPCTTSATSVGHPRGLRLAATAGLALAVLGTAGLVLLTLVIKRADEPVLLPGLVAAISVQPPTGATAGSAA